MKMAAYSIVVNGLLYVITMNQSWDKYGDVSGVITMNQSWDKYGDVSGVITMNQSWDKYGDVSGVITMNQSWDKYGDVSGKASGTKSRHCVSCRNVCEWDQNQVINIADHGIKLNSEHQR